MPHIRNPAGPVAATARPSGDIAWPRTKLLNIVVMISCMEDLSFNNNRPGNGFRYAGKWSLGILFSSNGRI